MLDFRYTPTGITASTYMGINVSNYMTCVALAHLIKEEGGEHTDSNPEENRFRILNLPVRKYDFREIPIVNL